jgi:hypothetical protein
MPDPVHHNDGENPPTVHHCNHCGHDSHCAVGPQIKEFSKKLDAIHKVLVGEMHVDHPDGLIHRNRLHHGVLFGFDGRPGLKDEVATLKAERQKVAGMLAVIGVGCSIIGAVIQMGWSWLTSRGGGH